MNVDTNNQLQLLKNNYQNCRHKEVIARDDVQGITIELHDRGMGREAFYAVHEGTPIAYCVGYRAPAPKRVRFQIQSTFVHPDWRNQGVGSKVYHAILNEGRLLVSDFELSDGAQRLWAKLMRDDNLKIRKCQNKFVGMAKSVN